MSDSKQSLRLAALSVLFAAATGAFAAGEVHQYEHAQSEAKLVLDHGKKWQTDAIARKGMENVRAALAADLKAIHTGKQTAAQYQALAATIGAEVATMVQNCKLDPRADVQFHQVIAELMAGAESMQGKDKAASPRRGAERVAKTVNAYGRYFEHPGWKRL
jgi:hypothetical protein